MGTLLIKRARIINPETDQDFIGDIFIRGEKIFKIGENLSEYLAQAEAVLDGNGLVAAPGLVDMHVHLREPGFEKKETVLTACRAAAAGGVTALLAMPNTKPAADTPEVVEYILNKAKTADAAVYVCAAITKNIQGEVPCDYQALKAAGAIAVSDDGRPVLNTRHLLTALAESEKLGMLLTAHCEDLTAAGSGIINQGDISKELGVEGIPAAAEDCGTAREIAAAASIGARIHICHVSTKGSVALIRDAKRRGVRVTAETAPHYLLLTEDALRGRDADFRMNPPLRTPADRQAVIEGLLDGTLDAIATDHAPHTPAEKQNFVTAPNGSIGMETSLSAVLTALGDTLPLSRIIQLMSVNPARLLNIPGGRLAEGEQADIVLFDPNAYIRVDPKRLHGKSENTPFKGMLLRGRVCCTIYKGRKVYQGTDE